MFSLLIMFTIIKNIIILYKQLDFGSYIDNLKKKSILSRCITQEFVVFDRMDRYCTKPNLFFAL